MKRLVLLLAALTMVFGIIAATGCGDSQIAVRPPVVQYVPPASPAASVTVTPSDPTPIDVAAPVVDVPPSTVDVTVPEDYPAPQVTIVQNDPMKTNDPANQTFSPVGHINGLVVDNYDNALLTGVTVTIFTDTGIQTTQTDHGLFGFTNIPKASQGAAIGYHITLDLTGATDPAGNARSYRPYQIASITPKWETDNDGESVPGAAPTATGATAGSAGGDPNTNTWINNTMEGTAEPIYVAALTANISGAVKSPVKLDDAANIGLLLTYCSQSSRLNTLPPMDAVVDQFNLPADVVSGGNGAYSFTGIEEGARMKVQFADPTSWFFEPAGTNQSGTYTYNGECFVTREAGATTYVPLIVAAPLDAKDPWAPWVDDVSYTTGGNTSHHIDGMFLQAGVSPTIQVQFNEPMNTNIDCRLGILYIVEKNRYGEEVIPDYNRKIPYTCTWDNTAPEYSVLVINPLDYTDFDAGFVYEFELDENFLMDLDGNKYDGKVKDKAGNLGVNFPDDVMLNTVTGVQNPVAHGPTTFIVQFVIQANVAPLDNIAGLRQFPRTSNTAGVDVVAKTSTILDPTSGQTLAALFDVHTRAGDFDVPGGAAQYAGDNAAYMLWNDPSGTTQIVAYEVVVGLRNNDPNPQVVMSTVGPGHDPYSFSGLRRGAAVMLADVLYTLQQFYGPTYAFTPDWSSGLTIYLGIRAYNADAEPGRVNWVTFRDNTAPVIADEDAAFDGGLNWNWLAANALCTGDASTCDTRILNYDAGNEILFPRLSGMQYKVASNNPADVWTVSALGQGILKVRLNEPVLKTAIATGATAFVTGTMNNLRSGVTDPNPTGEPDATVTAVGYHFDEDITDPAIPAGYTKTLFIFVSGLFGIDTGDHVSIENAGARDAAGNALETTAEHTWTFINKLMPYIESVTVTGTTNTIAVKFTHSISCFGDNPNEDDGDATNGNCGHSITDVANGTNWVDPGTLPLDFTTGNGADGGILPAAVLTAGLDSLVKIVSATLSADGMTLTLVFNDVASLLKDSVAVTTGKAINVDVFNTDGDRVDGAAGDDGTAAYVNWGGKGAYQPAGTPLRGTAALQADVVKPRLVNYPDTEAEVKSFGIGSHPNDKEYAADPYFNSFYTVKAGVRAADIKAFTICPTEVLGNIVCHSETACTGKLTMAWRRIGWCEALDPNCTPGAATVYPTWGGSGSETDGGGDDYQMTDATGTAPSSVKITDISAGATPNFCWNGFPGYDVTVNAEDTNDECGHGSSVHYCGYGLEILTLATTIEDQDHNTVDTTSNANRWTWHVGDPSATAELSKRDFWDRQ